MSSARSHHRLHGSPDAPRCHRGPTFAPAAHRVRRGDTAAGSPDHAGAAIPRPDRFGAQLVFLCARGLAILTAAVAIGFGAMGNEAPTPSPTSPQATTR